VLNGRACAAEWQAEVGEAVWEARGGGERGPGLAVVLVGHRPDSLVYVKRKREACASVGIAFKLHHLPAEAGDADIRAVVAEACEDPCVDGVLVQLPLPPHVDEEAVLEAVAVEKDVDGLHPVNVGRLAMRAGAPLYVPCTPLGTLELLRRSNVAVAGKRAVIVGNSNTVGTPLSMLLRDAGAISVTLCHRTALDSDLQAAAGGGPPGGGDAGGAGPGGRAAAGVGGAGAPEEGEAAGLRADAEACLPPLAIGGGAGGGGPRAMAVGGGFADAETLKSVTREADLLFVAVGSPELVRRDWVKPGAVVVDIGINVVPYDAARGAARVPTRGEVDVQVVGDVDFDAVAPVASAITPVPGGIGPMTIAALLDNTFASYLRASRQ